MKLAANPKVWLVTGVAGFIGSNLLEELLGLGQTIVGLDNFSTGFRANIQEALSVPNDVADRFTMLEGDIRDLDCCRSACSGVDFVLHHAALGSVPWSIEDPLTTNGVNVDGFVNVLVAANEARVQRLVYASSSAVYGDLADSPQIEERIGRPLSPYAASKSINEIYAAAFQSTYGLQSIGLRYFNVFGQRQDPAGAYAAVIPRWIRSLLDGRPCRIFGDGETTRDFVHVANVVQANLLAATGEDRATGHVYNVACGESVSLNDLFGIIRDRVALEHSTLAEAEPEYVAFRRGDVRYSRAAIDKVRRMLSYSPNYSVKEGLAASVSWYETRACTSDIARPGPAADYNRIPVGAVTGVESSRYSSPFPQAMS